MEIFFGESVQSYSSKTVQFSLALTPRKPDGVLTKKINGKTFVTEIYFDKKSKETFQDKLFKVIQSKGDSSE